MTAKRRKRKKIQPDDAFAAGPLHVARFGANVLFRSKWPEGTFAETQRRAAEHLPRVVSEIDTLVREIADLVSVLPAEQLLQRAWWQMAQRHMKIKAESEVQFEDGVAVRMIDYLQSVIAGVLPAASPRTEVTEQEWQALTARVESLFLKVTLDYQICLSAKNTANDPDFNKDFEEFRFRAQALHVQ
jgi:hypothetical protein